MPNDHIRYDVLVQKALRGMVRGVLDEVARSKSLPGDHHFFITFDTTADGIRMSPRLMAQYPKEMTIVLQHQFWDLKVTDEAFEVGLSFGGVAEKLGVPLDAIKVFADPSVQFTLQFETLAEGAGDTEAESAAERDIPEASREPPVRKGSVPAVPAESTDANADKQDGKGGAEVVRLDRFRKK
jgi:hypothetical protein